MIFYCGAKLDGRRAIFVPSIIVLGQLCNGNQDYMCNTHLQVRLQVRRAVDKHVISSCFHIVIGNMAHFHA
jgi:hypothetical protein